MFPRALTVPRADATRRALAQPDPTACPILAAALPAAEANLRAHGLNPEAIRATFAR